MRKKKLSLPILLLAVFLLSWFSGMAQDAYTVTGQVTDEKGAPIPFANIVVKGTSVGAMTDLDGNYFISIPVETVNPVLQYTFVGFQDKEEVVGSRTVISPVLSDQVSKLDEVVVIGYGTQKRRDVTTAISSVSTKDLDQRPIVSTGQAIQGKAAGVSVIQPNGAPGAGMVIRVRGTTSFNGSNDPLYVVDGVPVENINFLSPTDIASLQILKDASSASIYGSRAANGVILISTKQGRGEAKVTANIQVGVNTLSNRIESLNAAQYKELMDEIRPEAIPSGTTDRTDWYKEAYGTGITQNYQLQVAGGTDKINYFVSGGYLEEKGILASAFFKRYNFRTNLDNQVRKWLKIGVNTSYSDNTNNGITTGQGSNRGGVVLAVVNLPTAAPIRDENSGLYNRIFFGQNTVNPVEAIQNGKNNKDHEARLIASSNAVITILPDLNFKSIFTLDRTNGLKTNFTPPVHGDGRDDWGSASDQRTNNTVLVFENIASYKKSVGKHNFEPMVGTSWIDSKWSQSKIEGSHFKDEYIQTLNAANKINWESTGTTAATWGIMSYFGRLSYNFDSKYLVTMNARRDGSSRLSPSHRWGTFPSFSAAWRISAETFMRDFAWLDDLKIRAGWGKTGNQSGIDDYAYLQRYRIERRPWFETGQENALPKVIQDNLRTADLTWETTTQSNVGLDVAIFQNRVSITMDYYYKYTKDMLMFVSIPAGGGGADNIIRNEGEMSNRGFEFAVSSKNLVGKFSWNTDFNISFNRNRFEKLELQKIYDDAETSDAFHKTKVVRNQPGHSLGGFWGYISDGVNSETGELRYRDLNEDGKITASDKTYIGDPNPKFTYGITNTFSYKNFSLTIFGQGSTGNDIFNASKVETEGMYDLKNQSVEVLDRWRTPGQITDVPKANFDIQPSSYFIEDGTYFRVREISLVYNVAGAFLTKIGVARIQPYFTARNLITITKYKGMDPEVNEFGNKGAIQGIDWGTYPHSKSFVFGVNVEF